MASWSVAATFGKRYRLLGKQLEVMVEDVPDKVVTVNVIDTCSNKDCNGCCSKNTGNGKWLLIDLEKWPAGQLLGFNHSSIDFDINDVQTPEAGIRRKRAPHSMPLCYRIVGNSDV